jgi:hypothetical protein
MFIVFRGYDSSTFSYWFESILGMFRISLGAFGDIYETYDVSIPGSLYVWVPRVVFIIYLFITVTYFSDLEHALQFSKIVLPLRY